MDVAREGAVAEARMRFGREDFEDEEVREDDDFGDIVEGYWI